VYTKVQYKKLMQAVSVTFIGQYGSVDTVLCTPTYLTSL
jgi:hypothetical protein